MIIQSENVWINEKFVKAQVEINNGIITSISDYNQKPVDKDYGNLWILPGFIDIHTHGWNNVDANKAKLKTLEKWCTHMPQEGVTSFLASTSTQSQKANIKTLSTIGKYIETNNTGAEIIGINMEGNFISKECAGAQNKRYIVNPDKDIMEQYRNASNNHILTVTYAPEKDENDIFLSYCLDKGIAASIGHSNCDYSRANDAISKGASGITHTGNGMKPFHHRTPGLFAASCNNEDVYSEIIGDGVHVDFATVHLVGKMKGKDKLIMVTDSAVQKDDPKFDILKKSGAYKLPNGTLFGSALYVNKGLYNMIYNCDLPIETAINAVTINPARYLKVDKRKGSLEINKDGDIVVCDPTINLVQVYCKGVEQL